MYMYTTNCFPLLFAGDFVSTIDVGGQKVLRIKPEALAMLSEQAYIDVAHLLRPAHLQVIITYTYKSLSQGQIQEGIWGLDIPHHPIFFLQFVF